MSHLQQIDVERQKTHVDRSHLAASASACPAAGLWGQQNGRERPLEVHITGQERRVRLGGALPVMGRGLQRRLPHFVAGYEIRGGERWRMTVTEPSHLLSHDKYLAAVSDWRVRVVSCVFTWRAGCWRSRSRPGGEASVEMERRKQAISPGSEDSPWRLLTTETGEAQQNEHRWNTILKHKQRLFLVWKTVS